MVEIVIKVSIGYLGINSQCTNIIGHGGMGFRDLTAFNLAMLGKQGWKFQTQKDCLVSKLYKARYFPRSDYIEAKLGHNPSFVWRSIYSAKRVV